MSSLSFIVWLHWLGLEVLFVLWQPGASPACFGIFCRVCSMVVYDKDVLFTFFHGSWFCHHSRHHFCEAAFGLVAPLVTSCCISIVALPYWWDKDLAKSHGGCFAEMLVHSQAWLENIGDMIFLGLGGWWMLKRLDCMFAPLAEENSYWRKYGRGRTP